MENQGKITLTETDFRALSSLVSSANTRVAEFLEDELGRASVVADDQLPQDVVSMNSKVVYKDLETEKESTVTLVYPHDANMEENKVSILAPIGSALIGLRAGDIINWSVPQGKAKQLKVISVIARF